MMSLLSFTTISLVTHCAPMYVARFRAVAYLREFPMNAVVQIHLAGHTHCGTHIIDTHDKPVTAEVWELYRLAYQLTGGVSTLLEWDGNIPSFDECLQELNKAKSFMAGTFQYHEALKNTQAYEGLSTPIDYLVPDVINNVRRE